MILLQKPNIHKTNCIIQLLRVHSELCPAPGEWTHLHYNDITGHNYVNSSRLEHKRCM